MKYLLFTIACFTCSLAMHAQNDNVKIKVYTNKSAKDIEPEDEQSKENLYTKKKKEKDSQPQVFSFSYSNDDKEKQTSILSDKMSFYFNSESFNKDIAALGDKMETIKFDFDEKKLNEHLSEMNKKLKSYNLDNNKKLLIINDNGQYPQKDLFERLGNNKNITTVYISKGMLNMASNFAPDMGNIKTKDISKKLEQLEIYSSDNKDACRIMKTEVASFSRNKSYEVLMRIKDEFDDVTFYGVRDGQVFKEMIMIALEADECSIIRMIGTFTADDVKKVAGDKK